MSRRPIIIDIATVFDPARLIAVLASVDVRYSEVWVPQSYSHVKEKDYTSLIETDRIIGLLPDSQGRYTGDRLAVPDLAEKLDPKDTLTGPRVLAWAMKEGRVVPKDLSAHDPAGAEMIRLSGLGGVRESIILGEASEGVLNARLGDYWRKAGGGMAVWGNGFEWRFEPYGNGSGLGQILAARAFDLAEPFVSHPYFSGGGQTNNNHLIRAEALAGLGQTADGRPVYAPFSLQDSIEDARRIIASPEGIALEDVAFFLSRRERIEAVQGILNASQELEVARRSPMARGGIDCGIIVSKFFVTTAIDTFVFGGLPVAGTAATLFDVGARWITAKREADNDRATDSLPGSNRAGLPRV